MVKKYRFVMLIFALVLTASAFTACNKMQDIKYNVTFDVDGNNYFQIDTQGNELLQMPVNPKKDDCYFVGWFWDKDVWERPFDAESLLNESLRTNVRVYAKWEQGCNHSDIAVDKGYEATCTEDGLSDGTRCNICGEVLVRQEIIPAKSHHFKPDFDCNEIYHWHEADCGHSLKFEYAKHIFNEKNICNTCGYVKANSLHGTELGVKTFSLDGTNLYSKVSNSAETFSFINEISVANDATYSVHTKMSCSESSMLPSKTTSLKVGDNILYILVSNGNDIALYTVTIRRRPMYTVSFKPNCDIELNSLQVEEDSLIDEPAISRKGYTFDSWDYDFANAICENTVISAKWNINKYTVTYVLNGGTHDNTVTEYTVEDKSFALKDGVGDNLFCGWYLDDKFETYIDTVDTSECKNYTLYALFDGSKGLSIGNNGIVFEYIGDGLNVVIPSKYKGKNVTGISQNNYHPRYSAIYNITFPASMVDINRSVFGRNLIGITVSPDNPKYKSAGNCLIDIESKAVFLGCKASVIPEDGSVTKIDESAFYGTELQSIKIPDNIVSIGNYAFSHCSKLERVDIGDGVTDIGNCAFYSCSNLNNVYIGNNVNNIREQAFSYCSSLKNIDIGSNATNIGKQAFSYCTSLENANISNSVTGIADRAFENCSSLEIVSVGNGITHIDEGAFFGCEKLREVHILDLTRWCEISFYDKTANPLFYAHNLYFNNELVTGNLEIPYGVTGIGEYAFIGCNNITNLTVSDSVMSIYNYAFYECADLKSIIIGKNVMSISSRAFGNCSELSNIEVVQDNSTFYSENNCLIYSSAVFIGCKTSIIPTSENVRAIGSYAFEGCSGLENIIIPDNITSIGSYAFSGCNRLTSIKIPNSAKGIGEGAFSGCSGLVEITIPFVGKNQYISGGESLFGYIFGTINYEGSTKVSQWNGFEKYYVYYLPSSLRKVTVNGVKIPYGAFYGCSGLTSIALCDEVTNIDSYAFHGCSGLTSIIIPDSVTKIGNRPFFGCNGLIELTIPFFDFNPDVYGVTEIRLGCLFGKYDEEYKMVDYVPPTLRKVTVKRGAVPCWFFRYCSNLTEINIPVFENKGELFDGCKNLERIGYQGTIEQWLDGATRWRNYFNDICVVYCTDGTIDSSGNINKYE